MKKRSNLYLYLLLNVILSAATTLTVIVVWNRLHPPAAAPVQSVGGQPALLTPASAESGGSNPAAAPSPTFAPSETPLPLSEKVIDVMSVVGVGDLQQEVVLLKRLGEGNLPMAGWTLQGEHGSSYTFPNQPALTLFKDGAVQVYTKAGSDTATEVYWNRTETAWHSGETIRVMDAAGNERARYTIP